VFNNEILRLGACSQLHNGFLIIKLLESQMPCSLCRGVSIALMSNIMCLQMRHPLALAHYANHPAAGTQPNVMVAAFTYNPRQGTLCLICIKA
jgi:hypothetical protein